MNRAEVWMSLEAGDFDEATARAEWLERALVGLDLATVISELAAVAGSPADLAEVPPESVRSWLGPDTTAVLQQGLVRLPQQKFNELFRRPELLAGLQEVVLTDGGPYWNELVGQDVPLNKFLESGRDVVIGKLGLGVSTHAFQVGRDHNRLWPAQENRIASPGAATVLASFSRRIWPLVPVAAAAALLVVVASTYFRRQSAGLPEPADEQLVIVKAVVSDEQPDGMVASGSRDGGWEAHPWQGFRMLAKDQTGSKQDWLRRIGGSKDWSRRLDETDNLTATQVRAAAKQAQDAVAAIQNLATSMTGKGQADRFVELTAKCRTVMAELNHLQSTIAADGLQNEGIGKAKKGIVRALDELERTLREAVPEGEDENPR